MTARLGTLALATLLGVALCGPAMSAKQDEEDEFEFDVCGEVAPDDPMVRLVRTLTRPDGIHPKVVTDFDSRERYEPGIWRYNRSSRTWGVLQKIPGWQQLESIVVFRDRGAVKQIAHDGRASLDPGTARFSAAEAPSIIVGLDVGDDTFDVAEVSFDTCISIETVELRWLSVGVSKHEALVLIDEPDALYGYIDVSADPPSPYDAVFSNPLEFRVAVAYQAKSMVRLWTDPELYLQRLDPASR